MDHRYIIIYLNANWYKDAVVFTDGKIRLIILINEDKIKKTVKLVNQNFSNNLDIYDYYSGENMGNAEQINTEIPPNEARVFIVKPAK